MKKSIFSLLLAFLCMIAIAQPGNNGTPQLPKGSIQPKVHWQPQGHQFTSNQNITLMICSPNNERFWLYINDQLYTRQSVYVAKIDLSANFIWNIKVMMDNRSRDIINEKLCLGGNSDDIVLTVERSQSHGRIPGHYRLRWNGQKINPGEDNYAYLWMYKNDPRGVRFACGMDFYPLNVPVTPQPVVQPTPPTPPAPMPCSAADFQNIKNIIRSQTFENDRMNVALQAIRGQRLTANQIAELAELFKFENDRVKFLKSAYGECFDRQNYYVVYRVLTFSSSKDELTKYMQSH